MASSNDFLEYILEQLSDLDGITYRYMMSEYIIYYNGKIIGGIYDNHFLVKPLKSAIKYVNELCMNCRMMVDMKCCLLKK